MKISATDHAIFRAVMTHFEFDPEEIESAKEAYRRDPDGGRGLYQAIYNNEVTDLWRKEMNKEMIEKYQADKQREQPEPVRDDPPKEVA